MRLFIFILITLVSINSGCTSSQDKDALSTHIVNTKVQNHPQADINFYKGDGLGYNLRLTLNSNNQFTLNYSSCLTQESSGGSYSIDDTKNKLTLIEHNLKESTEVTIYDVIDWDGRKYLIQNERLVDFANAINAGLEPRKNIHGDFLLRDGDEAIKTKSFPPLPDFASKYLLSSPIYASVKPNSIWKTEKNTVKAILNKGAKDGVLEAMTFYTYTEPASVLAVVTKLYEFESEIEMMTLTEREKTHIGNINIELSTKIIESGSN